MKEINVSLSQEKKITQKNNVCGIDFEELVYDLKLLDVKILKLFYVPKSTCWTLDHVVKKIKQKGVDVSKETVRRYLIRLDKLNLLKVIKKSKPLAIQSNHKIKKEVNKLIILTSARLTA
ncbi:hypothetical protein GF374_01285 [Candidatus Woesearchaeota archaeon]|nr:hypothetical protein [Candidatus Woesearchaeota archaeon]